MAWFEQQEEKSRKKRDGGEEGRGGGDGDADDDRNGFYEDREEGKNEVYFAGLEVRKDNSKRRSEKKGESSTVRYAMHLCT